MKRTESTVQNDVFGAGRLMDRVGTRRTVQGVLSFSDATAADYGLIESLAEVSDLYLDDNTAWHIRLVELLASVSVPVLVDTFRPLTAELFARFATSDPDCTASEVALTVAPVVLAVWDIGERDPQRPVVELIGGLIASDFSPLDTDIVRQAQEFTSARLVTALAQWTVAMSVTLSYIEDVSLDGGDPIRWFSGSLVPPDPDLRVIVGGAALD
jgi:hypothetical protein